MSIILQTYNKTKTLNNMKTKQLIYACALTSSSFINVAAWETPQKIRTVAAPMVAQSDLAFRRLVRKHGCDLTYTQMIHATNFCKSEKFQRNHLDVFPMDNKFQEEDRPVFVQIAGYDPKTMTEAAIKIVELADGNLDCIDINLGCPQSIARKGRYGAFLFAEQGDTVCNIIRSLRRNLPEDVGVSAKVRILDDEKLFFDKIRRMEDSGLNLMTVHGRTRRENKTAVGKCNWNMIKDAVELLDIPVIANGGIENPSDVNRCLDATGAIGVMSSEALLENPAIFRDGEKDDLELSGRELVDRQFKLAEEYLALARECPPLKGSLGENGGHATVKGHLFKILYRFLDHHVDLRDKLGDSKCYHIDQSSSIIRQLKDRFDIIDDDELEFSIWSSWYRRHRSENSVEKVLSVSEKKILMRERIKALKEARSARALTF
uniref:tRNA-dihydrouridine(16/17) synthase [NAD(P)(+)] n=1 Tax=Leptocylindrus aporus TaxID=1398097 RepID=A0A7S0PHH6_9STRA|mmetsp:Transcript_1612/g.2172  ORF Transcript_1612/g.2172 Transcript_1612/m.2172 type:complete len:433 (+) Transcript_1612:443-1741(+)